MYKALKCKNWIQLTGLKKKKVYYNVHVISLVDLYNNNFATSFSIAQKNTKICFNNMYGTSQSYKKEQRQIQNKWSRIEKYLEILFYLRSMKCESLICFT